MAPRLFNKQNKNDTKTTRWRSTFEVFGKRGRMASTDAKCHAFNPRMRPVRRTSVSIVPCRASRSATGRSAKSHEVVTRQCPWVSHTAAYLSFGVEKALTSGFMLGSLNTLSSCTNIMHETCYAYRNTFSWLRHFERTQHTETIWDNHSSLDEKPKSLFPQVPAMTGDLKLN